MAWIYLVVAGVFEIAWPVGLKLAQKPNFSIQGISIAAIGMLLSDVFLFLAQRVQRVIPIGTTYSVWTGLGAIGTFFIGLAFFQDPASLLRFFGITLILGGVILLKVATQKAARIVISHV